MSSPESLEITPSSATAQASARTEPELKAPPLEQLVAEFPQCEILEFVAGDGVSSEYRVRERETGRAALLRIWSYVDASATERFQERASALMQLGHPNIATVFSCGKSEHWCFVLSEEVAGTSILQAAANGALSAGQALAAVSEICAALKYAHEHGINHGGLRAENVILISNSQVKITGIGLSSLDWSDDSRKDDDGASDIAALGVIVGDLRARLPVAETAPTPVALDVVRMTSGATAAFEPTPAGSSSAEPTIEAPAAAASIPPSSEINPADELQLPANVLITLGVCELLSVPFSILSAAWMDLLIALLWSVSAVVIGSVTVLAGISLKRQQNYGLTAVGLALSAVPSLLWIIKLPFLALAFNELRKREVRLSFRETAWAQSDAWVLFRKYALGTKEAARYAGITGGHIARVCAVPIKWFQLNPKFLWSVVFSIALLSWTVFCVMMSAFAAHADQLRQGLADQSIPTGTLLRVTLLALLPFLLGAGVLGRHCLRRYRRSQTTTWKEHMAGPTEAMLSLLVMSLLVAALVSLQTSLSQWMWPSEVEQSAGQIAQEVAGWQRFLPSGSLNVLYFGYAIFAAFILVLLPWQRPKALTRTLLIVGMGILPIGMMILAGNAIQLSFFWSLLLPIWLAIPAAGWALVNLTLPPKTL